MREMKDSGIPWIGKVPSNWLVEPIFSDFVEVTRKNKFGREKKALKFTYGEIVPKANFDADNDNYVADTILNYTIVEPGTIMLNGLNLNYDFISQRIGLVKQKGVITSAYTAFKPINMQKISSKYSTYLFKAYDNCKAFHNMGGGVRKILNFKELSKQPFIHPPIGEQRRIADYLDTKCARIDSIRKNVEAEIEALKQYKKSVITEAVTKGLDKNVEMKNSGIPWIGEIPKNWKIGQIKYYYEVVLGKMIQANPQNTSDTLENYACAANIKWTAFDTSINKQMWFSPQDKKEYLLKKGDVLVMEGGTAGTACIYRNEFVPCYIQNSVNRCRAKSLNSLNEFLYYWLFNVFYIGYISSICNKATIMHYTKEKLQQTPLVVIPIEEQHRIADYLDAKCAKIDSIIQKKQELLANLDTYKKSLIYEYVTGKKEVPAV